MKTAILTICLLISLTVNVQSQPLNPDIGGFEGKIKSFWKNNQLDEIPEPFSKHVNRVSSPVSSGNYSLKVQLADNSPMVCKGPRVELKYLNMGRIDPSDNERWLTLRTFIPNNWEYDNKDDIIFQLHTYPEKDLGEVWNNPPFALRVNGDTWRFTNRYDSRKITPLGEATQRVLWQGSLVKNRWVCFDIHVIWSCCDQDGLIEIWQDGIKIVTATGPNTYNNPEGYFAGSKHKIGHFLKFGIYKPDWKNKTSLVSNRMLYFDEVYVGKSFSDIAKTSYLTSTGVLQIPVMEISDGSFNSYHSAKFKLIDQTNLFEILEFFESGTFGHSPSAELSLKTSLGKINKVFLIDGNGVELTNDSYRLDIKLLESNVLPLLKMIGAEKL